MVWEKIGSKYIKKCRIRILSKEESNIYYPEYGNMRTIAIAPCITKLFDKCKLEKLIDKIKVKT